MGDVSFKTTWSWLRAIAARRRYVCQVDPAWVYPWNLRRRRKKVTTRRRIK